VKIVCFFHDCVIRQTNHPTPQATSITSVAHRKCPEVAWGCHASHKVMWPQNICKKQKITDLTNTIRNAGAVKTRSGPSDRLMIN